MAITREQVRALRSLNLRDETVQEALAGFLSEGFGLFEPVLLHAIQRFVQGIESRQLEKAVQVYNSGQFRAAK